MGSVKKGPKSTRSGWAHVYDLPNRHGRTRWYFWFGGKGQRQYRVENDIIYGREFQAAYARFLAGQHPYQDQELVEQAKARTSSKDIKPETPLNQFPVGTAQTLPESYGMGRKRPAWEAIVEPDE